MSENSNYEFTQTRYRDYGIDYECDSDYYEKSDSDYQDKGYNYPDEDPDYDEESVEKDYD